MIFTYMENGDLEMRATPRERRNILRIGQLETGSSEQKFIEQFLEPDGYYSVNPETVGALTSAPLIGRKDSVWGFMNYQVESFLQTLVKGGIIIWQKG